MATRGAGIDVAAPDPDTAAELVFAIRAGDIDAVQRVAADTPELATAPLGGRFKTRTALHVVADWPGYFPNGPEIVRLLLAVGADANARSPGSTIPPGHVRASSNASAVSVSTSGVSRRPVPVKIGSMSRRSSSSAPRARYVSIVAGPPTR
jgi:uncharacterized protein